MLKPIRPGTRSIRNSDCRFVIVASQYNARFVDAMLRAAQGELRRAGARTNQVEVVRVPGAFEIPVVAARIAEKSKQSMDARISAFVCLGVILRGETTHAAHIGESVTQALMEISTRYCVPVVHEVLLLENAAQARARCLGRHHNRGAEAAQTAIAMTKVMEKL